MAFFDKLNDIAKNLGEMTNDAIETGKLNNKVNAEKTAAGEELKKIGEYYYSLYLAGGETVPEVAELCAAAQAHYDAAQAAQAEIDRIRAENEAAKAAAAAPAPAAPAPTGAACPACGARNAAGTRFCQNCGNKLELAPRQCPGCGAEVAAGTRFCAQCGQKME